MLLFPVLDSKNTTRTGKVIAKYFVFFLGLGGILSRRTRHFPRKTYTDLPRTGIFPVKHTPICRGRGIFPGVPRKSGHAAKTSPFLAADQPDCTRKVRRGTAPLSTGEKILLENSRGLLLPRTGNLPRSTAEVGAMRQKLPRSWRQISQTAPRRCVVVQRNFPLEWGNIHYLP